MTPDPDDPILFLLRNDTEREQTVTLTVALEETTLLDESVQIAADDSAEFNPGISSTGTYTVAVTVEGGPEWTAEHSIESFDVRNGSNHFIIVQADSVTMYWEE